MGQGSETLGDYFDFYEFDDDECEIRSTPRKVKPKITNTPKKEVRGSKVTKPCDGCGVEHTVRVADLKRGWGRFCSKSCKAKKQ